MNERSAMDKFTHGEYQQEGLRSEKWEGKFSRKE